MSVLAGHRRNLRTATLLAALAVITPGCADPEFEELGVDISFAPGTGTATREQTVRAEAYLVSSCEQVWMGTVPKSALTSTYVLSNDESGPPGGSFEHGDYGLYAVARDDQCEVIAAGCAEVTIDENTEGPLSVTIASVRFGEDCDGGRQCISETGECVEAPVVEDCAGEPDRTDCSIDDVNGQCRSGECCTGCWDGTSCQPGDEPAQCGTGGERCDSVGFCP